MSDPHPPRKRFHHIGLPSVEQKPDEHYVIPWKCWVTNPNRHPQHVESLRFEPDSPLTEEFREAPHVAYEVEEFEPHTKGRDVYLDGIELGDPPFATIVVIREDGLFIELMKFAPGRAWYDH